MRTYHRFPLRWPTLALFTLLGLNHSFATQTSATTASTAELADHIVMLAKSFIPAPNDVPADMKVSDKYTTGSRVTALNSVPAKSADRLTGLALPVEGQSLQGDSGIKHMPDGTYWVLTDNGYGTKANSPDSLLYLTHYQMDFKNNTASRLETVFLPDKRVPFHIVNESTDKRYLTGADFDPESFQFADGSL